MAVRLEPLWCARRVTAPQAPLRTAAALPIQVSTGTFTTAVSLHDPSWVRLGSLIMRLTCFRAVELSTPIPQKTDTLGRSQKNKSSPAMSGCPYPDVLRSNLRYEALGTMFRPLPASRRRRTREGREG